MKLTVSYGKRFLFLDNCKIKGKKLNIRLKATGRSGQYIKQNTGYKAFFPASLDKVRITIDQEMQTLLSDADRALGRLDGSIDTLPNSHLFVLMYIRKEAVLSRVRTH